MAKAPTIAAGPSSGNDSYSATEEQIVSGALILNVLANDARKSTLHSVDNGEAADLVTKDQVLISEQSRLGASIWITSDGRIGYALDSAQAQSLAAGETFQDSFLYAIRLSSGSLVWQSVQVTITGTNDGPVARADSAAVSEDALSTGSVALNDSDVDHGAVLSYATAGQVPAGFAMTSDGGWAFDGSDPAYQSLGAGETMELAVAYTVTDEHGATSSATLSLTVTGTNDAPIVTGAVLGAAAEDGAGSTLSALANATDVDAGAALSVVDVPANLPPGVSYDPASRTFSLDPTHAAYQALAQGATATVTVSYGVSDGTATTAASVSWTVTGTNDAPIVTGAVQGDAAEDGAGSTLSALANATDVDAGTSLAVVGLPAELPPGVSYDLGSKSFTLDPSHPAYQSLAAGATATVSVSYGVSDGAATTPASVSWTVTGTNDAPTVTGAVIGVAAEDGAGSILSALANATDADAGAALSVVDVPAELPPGVSYDPASRTFTLDPTHAAYQALAQGATATVTVSYGLSDGTATTAASVSWTVTGTNDGPVATAATAAVAEDQAISGTLAATDVDAGANLVFEPNSGSPAGFTLNADGSWNFDANIYEYQSLAEGESRDVVIDYVVTDDRGETSISTLTVTVTGANDAPGTTSHWAEVTEGETTTGWIMAQDQDHGAQLTFAVDGEGPAGFILNTDGTWTFDGTNAAYDSLANGEVRLIQFPFSVTDEHGATTSSFMILALHGGNDAPVVTGAVLGETVEDGAASTLFALANAVDPDTNAVLSVVDIQPELPPGVSYDPTSQSFTLDPAHAAYQSLAAGASTTVTVSYGVSDGTATTAGSVSWTVTGTNDGPALTGTATQLPNGTEDTAYVVSQEQLLSGWSDPEGSSLIATNLSAANANVADNGDGSFTITPAADFNGILDLGYQVSDGHSSSSTSLSFTIGPANDAPRLVGTPTTFASIAEDTSLRITADQLLAGWSDPEGDPLQLSGLTVSQGSLRANADGSWTYFPSVDWNGTLALSYNVGDGNGALTATSLPITVTPVNDAPRYNPSTPGFTMVEDVAYTFTQAELLRGWTDPEGVPLTAVTVSLVGGTTVNNPDGTFTVTAKPDFFGAATLWVTVSDGQLSRTNPVSLTVQAVADPARISGPTSGAVTEDLQFRATGNLNSIEPDNAADNDKWIAQTTRASDNGYGTYFVNSAGVWTYDLNGSNPTVNALNSGEQLTDTFTVRTLDGTAQQITITINGSTDYAPPPISTAADENDFDLLRADQEKPSTLYHYSATAADDLVDGSVSFDIVDGHGGADTLYGHGGADTLYGEIDYPSRAQLVGVTGNDLLYGQQGNDYLYGSGGSDTLYGGSGVDYLYGDDNAAASPAAGNDTLYGGSGDDRMYGEGGDDVLVGGTGADMIFGGAGADRFVYTKGADTGDWILDFQRGTDLLDLSALSLSSANFVGALSARGAVGAGQVGYWVQSGTTELYLYVDTDGVDGADLEIHISGNNQLSSSDIFWG